MKGKAKGKGYGGKMPTTWMSCTTPSRANTMAREKGSSKARTRHCECLHHGLRWLSWTGDRCRPSYGLACLCQRQLQRSSDAPSPIGGGMGMLDSGATCSAGPEGSINRLIAAVLERDHA